MSLRNNLPDQGRLPDCCAAVHTLRRHCHQPGTRQPTDAPRKQMFVRLDSRDPSSRAQYGSSSCKRRGGNQSLQPRSLLTLVVQSVKQSVKPSTSSLLQKLQLEECELHLEEYSRISIFASSIMYVRAADGSMRPTIEAAEMRTGRV
jgi:hypothetical protein